MISEGNQQTLEALWDAYNALPRYIKFFCPGDLAAAIELFARERTPASAFAVCNILLTEPSFFQRRLFPFLWTFSNSGLALVFRQLNNAGLLIGEMAGNNCNAVLAHQDLLGVSYTLSILNVVSLLTNAMAQANFDAVMRYPNPRKLGLTIHTIKLFDILTAATAQVDFNAAVANQFVVFSGLHQREVSNRDAVDSILQVYTENRQISLSRARAYSFFADSRLWTESEASLPTDISLGPNAEKIKELNIPDTDIPESYICPLSFSIMSDPVYLIGDETGQRYERSWITKWLTDKGTHPITRQPFELTTIESDTVLKTAIDELMQSIEKNGFAFGL
jgi:hypothetical protein